MPFFPSKSGFLCTNFAKFTNFYNKCPNFVRFWWTSLSIIVSFYVKKHSIIPICQHFQYIISLSRGSIIFELPPPNDPLPREDPPHTHTHQENAPPPYFFCIFEFIFRYLVASQSFWLSILCIDPKNCWFHLCSIALDPFGKLQKIRPKEKSDTLFSLQGTLKH